MESYVDMQVRHQKEFNELSERICFYAFDQKQFEKGCRKLGIAEPEKELYQGWGGMFCRKNDYHLIEELFDKHERERKAAATDDYIRKSFETEMWNHEYGISFDDWNVAGAAGYSVSEIQNDDRLLRLWIETKRKYLKEFEKLNC